MKVRACALCTWEQRSYTGEERLYPLSSGHEISGELVEMGSEALTAARIGDRVVGSMLCRCGCCEPCRRGMDNICDNNRKAYGDRDVVGPAGLAEYVLMEDYQVYRAHPSAVTFGELSLAEPVACVIRSVRKAGLERADRVVVIGAGIMGILHLVLAKQAGTTVLVSETDARRADFALEMGADGIIDAGSDSFADSVKELTDGIGVDVVFCAVSAASAVEQALDVVAKGGRVLVYASIHPRGRRISIDPNLFHSREVVLTGTMSQDRDDMRQAVQMISRGTIDLTPLISATFPLMELEDALQAAMRQDTYRVIVMP
jgi:L-iditol 2-dehydrogenase